MNLPGSRSGIVTLTTDFGTTSSYVGSLRGALLSVSSRLVLADISHDVEPFSVMEGALILRGASGAFPQGTVHLAVVDPGVGGSRRPLIVSSAGAIFVGPDNGLFTPFLGATFRAWALDPARVSKGAISPTFHGRDLFAPAAARLAGGEEPGALGSEIEDPVRLDWPEARVTPTGVEGVVLHVDRFGNLITNIPEGLLSADVASVAVTGGREARFVTTYDEAPAGTLVALIGSGGLLEVAITRGSAARETGAGAGATVALELA